MPPENAKRKASIARQALRSMMSSMRWFLPTQATLKQVKVGQFQVLCWINDAIGRRLYLARAYEAEDIAALKAVVRTGDIIADVGANIGYLTINLATFTGPSGRVISFEPMPHLHPVAALNATLNGLKNVVVHPMVVSETSDATAVANIPEGGAPCAYFTLSSGGDGVKTVRLDEFANRAGIKRFDVVKIDVEGGEVSVLKSARDLLQDPARRPRTLMIEIVDAQLKRFNHKLEDIYEILIPLGYKATIYRSGAFEPVANPRDADCWNVFFTSH